MEKEVIFHLGVAARAFRNGQLDDDLLENVDETHFVVNMDNGKDLAFVGCEEVKYADVASGGEDMTIMVRITAVNYRNSAAIYCFPEQVLQLSYSWAYQMLSQVFLTGLFPKAGCIKWYFWTGYLSEGQYQKIFITVSGRYFVQLFWS